MKKGLFIILGLLFTLFLFVTYIGSHSQNDINLEKLTGDYDYQNIEGLYLGQKVKSSEVFLEPTEDVRVLGVSDNKRIEVDLSSQRLYAYEGNNLVYNFLISSGKWGRTPTGTFVIWGKFRYTKMEGGKKELNTYYYLPNVPYVMFFSNDQITASRGFSIHGTYWHSNFGHPMSHGCINMKTEEAALIYAWANPNLGDKKSGRATDDNPGTPVIVYGVAPKN